MLTNLKLKIIRQLASSLLVNVRKHPEELTHHKSGSVSCDKNYRIAKIFEAIDGYK